MGIALIKLKIMPTSPEVDMEALKELTKERISAVEGEVTKFEEEPIAFGLKALITFIRIDENKDTSTIEEALKGAKNVSSSEIIDYRRSIE